jgi:hypothetical protein
MKTEVIVTVTGMGIAKRALVTMISPCKSLKRPTRMEMIQMLIRSLAARAADTAVIAA